jgi:epoxyqueuosine reductase
MMSVEQSIKEKTYSLGFDLAGICEAKSSHVVEFFRGWIEKNYDAGMHYLHDSLNLRENPQSLLEDAKAIIAVGLNYYQSNSYEPRMPRIATYALGRDYHKVIRSKLKKLAMDLQKDFPNEKFRACVDSAPIFERAYAQQAGLGWFGKNTCLINSHRGSYFFIGLLLTTLELQTDLPSEGGCGTCRKCIDACPTKAIIFENGRWQVNSNRCISYWTIEHKSDIPDEMAAEIGEWTFGCDVCQDVCPFNQPRDNQPLRSECTKEMDFLNKKPWPNLIQLSQISYDRWDQLTQGSAVRRVGYEGIKRNAKINLKNSQD